LVILPELLGKLDLTFAVIFWSYKCLQTSGGRILQDINDCFLQGHLTATPSHSDIPQQTKSTA